MDELNTIFERDGATRLQTCNNKGDKKILFICKCGNYNEKTRHSLLYKTGGAYCKPCLKANRNEKVKKTNQERRGVDFPFQSDEVIEKIKETNKTRYGSENPAQSEEIKERTRVTCLEVYGVDHPFKNKDVQEKRKATFLKTYGVENPSQCQEVMNRIRATMLKLYGVEYALQNELIMEQVKDTCLLVYGCEHPMQNTEVQEKAQKNAFMFKIYKMPSGNERLVQGYEPFALNDLLKIYTEDQLKTDRKDVPRIQYEVNGKKHYHFPDIFIPHENKLVEVKSTWTYSFKTDNIQLKKKACEEQGYIYEILIYDRKGTRVDNII